MTSDTEERTFGRKQVSAKVDFVDFVGRKEFVAHLELNSLIETRIFQEVLSDFAGGIVCLSAASARLLSVLTEKFVSGHFHPVHLPRVIKWGYYRSQLDPHDSRYIRTLRDLTQYYSPETRAKSSALYDEFVERTPAHKRNDTCSRLQATDVDRYLEHWKQAFPEEFEAVMSDHRLLAQLASAGYHGVDHVSDIYGSSMETFSGSLPLLDPGLRLTLFSQIGEALAQNLICLNFDPKSDYPEYFVNKGWWLS